MFHILSVSYDESLLRSRQLILESNGYRVTSALGFAEAQKHCQSSANFDVFLLGHSIPRDDQEILISEFRSHSSAPLVALKRHDREPLRGADFEIEARPEEIIELMAKIASNPEAPNGRKRPSQVNFGVTGTNDTPGSIAVGK